MNVEEALTYAATSAAERHVTPIPGGEVSTILDVSGRYETARLSDDSCDLLDARRFDSRAAALEYHAELVARAEEPEALDPWVEAARTAEADHAHFQHDRV